MITPEEGEDLASELGCLYLEVGIKSGQGMENMFDKLYEKYIKSERQAVVESAFKPEEKKKKKKRFFFF